MGLHIDEALTFSVGDVKALPHTLSGTRHLTLTLVAVNASDVTADLELHNPEAQPDEMTAALIETNLESVEATNHWRDELHLPEKVVPVDTSTLDVVAIHAKLHQKLQIGDRVWTVSALSGDGVTLTPGHDFDAHTLVNQAIEESGYSPEAVAAAETLGGIADAGL